MKENFCLRPTSNFMEIANLSSMQEVQRRIHEDGCNEDTESYQEYLQKMERMFPNLPKETQQAFCHIKKTIVLQGGGVPFGGSAFLSLDYKDLKYEDENLIEMNANGFVMFLDGESRFDGNETIEQIENRIANDYFGNDTRENPPIGDFPSISYVNDSSRSTLYATVVHEVGHFLDYANKVNIDVNFNTYSDEWSGISFDYLFDDEQDQYIFKLKDPELLSRAELPYPLDDPLNVFLKLMYMCRHP